MLRLLTAVFSVALHGLLAYVSLTSDLLPESAMAFEQGSGNDMFVIEKGIGIEGFMQEGEAVETVEANETPTQMSEARPQIDEIKPVEQAQETPPDAPLKDTEIIESKEGPAAETLPVEEEKPKEIEQQRAPQMATLEQLEEQQVTEEQKAAGQKQQGGDAGLRRAYLGRITKKLQTTKVNPHSRATGTVIVRFEVGPSGALLSREVIASSGSQMLDNAALASVDKAAPFPAFPDGLKAEKIVEVVPYRFSVR